MNTVLIGAISLVVIVLMIGGAVWIRAIVTNVDPEIDDLSKE